MRTDTLRASLQSRQLEIFSHSKENFKYIERDLQYVLLCDELSLGAVKHKRIKYRPGYHGSTYQEKKPRLAVY